MSVQVSIAAAAREVTGLQESNPGNDSAPVISFASDGIPARN
jgi:hypothetical protein